MNRKLLLFCLTVSASALGGGGLGFGLSGTPIPDRGQPAWLDVGDVRELAGDRDLPSQLDAVVVGINRGPGLMVTPWGGLQLEELYTVTLRISYSDGRSVIIDTGPNEATMKEMTSGATWSVHGWDQQVAWLDEADLIAVTHEHADHLSGLTQHPRFPEIAPQIRLTGAQRMSPMLQQVEITEAHLAQLSDYDYAHMTQLSPGIVLIQAPGHTPGSQVVYVRTTEVELLLVGDIAWSHTGISDPIQKPRVMSYGLLGEDTTAIGGQLMRLHELETSHPDLYQVVSHDGADWEQLAQKGVLSLSSDL